MANDNASRSYIQYLKSSGRENCGYCQKGSGFKRFELWAFHLNAEDYQAMIDRGWRRSGHYCYKPILSQSCCPMYTIRCETKDFALSRSQKKVLKAMNTYLHTGNKRKAVFQLATGESINKSLDREANKPRLMQVDPTVGASSEPNELAETRSNEIDRVELPVCKERGTLTPSTRRVHPDKAKFKRIQRKLNKLKSLGLSEDEINKKMVEKKRYPVIKTLEDYVREHDKPGAKHQLQVRLVRSQPPSAEFKATYRAEFELFKKYQTTIHKDPPSKVSHSGFDNFLVKSPMYDDGDFGSFHLQYWLDDKLIAVSVIDVLSACVSSVYLFYDPSFAFLCLGTYGALREIYFTRLLTKSYPNLHLYYMGFYIHLCKKMLYKAAFKPSFLLCPEALTWHPYASSKPKIDVNPVSRLNDDPDAKDEDGRPELLADILVIYKSEIMYAADLPNLRKYEELLKEVTSVLGKKTSSRIILQLVDK